MSHAWLTAKRIDVPHAQGEGERTLLVRIRTDALDGWMGTYFLLCFSKNSKAAKSALARRFLLM